MLLTVQPWGRLNLFGPLRAAAARRGFVPDWIPAAAFVATILYPTLVVRSLRAATPLTGTLFRSTLPSLIAVIFLVWANALWAQRKSTVAARNTILVTGVYVLTMLLLAKVVSRTESVSWVSNFERPLLVLPMSAAAGWMLVRSGRTSRYLSWMLAVAVVTVAPAIYEHYGHVSIFHGSSYVRSGAVRAVVGADHPLVLATLFAALIPVAIWLCGRWGIPVALFLYFGTFMTGSSGPELVGGIVLGVSVLTPLGRLLLRSWRPLTALLFGILAYLIIGASFLWSAQIHGNTSEDISHAYRGSLYYLLPKILVSHPFGYGPGGLPDGVWFVATSHGNFDLGRSIDSEVVYAASQYGWIAVFAYIAAALIPVLAVARQNALGLCAFTTTIVGLFLAVHSWFALGSFWFLGIGACAAVMRGHGTELWTGMTGKRVSTTASTDVPNVIPAPDKSRTARATAVMSEPNNRRVSHGN